jgi:hypothetical protein
MILCMSSLFSVIETPALFINFSTGDVPLEWWSNQNLVCAISQLNRIQHLDAGGVGDTQIITAQYYGAIEMMQTSFCLNAFLFKIKTFIFLSLSTDNFFFCRKLFVIVYLTENFLLNQRFFFCLSQTIFCPIHQSFLLHICHYKIDRKLTVKLKS